MAVAVAVAVAVAGLTKKNFNHIQNKFLDQGLGLIKFGGCGSTEFAALLQRQPPPRLWQIEVLRLGGCRKLFLSIFDVSDVLERVRPCAAQHLLGGCIVLGSCTYSMHLIKIQWGANS